MSDPSFYIDELNDNGRETICVDTDLGVIVRLTYEGETIWNVDVGGYEFLPHEMGIYVPIDGVYYSIAVLISYGAMQIHDLIEVAREDERAAEKAARELRSDYYEGVL